MPRMRTLSKASRSASNKPSPVKKQTPRPQTGDKYLRKTVPARQSLLTFMEWYSLLLLSVVMLLSFGWLLNKADLSTNLNQYLLTAK